jgi:phenylalanyl-tRNA synthetase beta subunit
MFRSDDHTLTDQEIKNEFDKIVKNLKQKGWSIR